MKVPTRKIDDRKHLPIPLLVAILMAVLQLIRIVWLAQLSVSVLVQHIPDDAFYYLVLAKNYLSLHKWTFDGVSSSSGFHLMWAYVLIAIYRIVPAISFKEIFVLASTLSAISLSAAAGLSVASVQKVYGRDAGWAAAGVLFSAVSMLQATWMMESPLVILMASLLVFQISTNRESSSWLTVCIAVVLGFLGSMARSDFGLLPLWLFIACALLARKDAQGIARLKLAAGQLIGASLGVCAVLVHVYVISGHIAQASAQTKLWWATVQGRSFGGPLRVGENTLSPFYNAVAPFQHTFWSGHLIGLVEHRSRTLLLMLVLVGLIALFLREKLGYRVIFTFCMLFVIASYCFFYRFDGGVQDWYVANYEIPFIFLVSAAWTSIGFRWLIVARTVVVALIISGFLFSFCSHAPWQEAMYRAGLLIKQHPEWKPVGAWNAGIMNYFAGGGVVNLDGLVNDDSVPYIKNEDLASYIAQRKISYIVESPSLFGTAYAKRSGILDGKLYSCIFYKRELFPDDPMDTFDNTHITLFRVDDACLK